jgi:hypothetical protein
VIYCIGLTERYEAALSGPVAPMKRGAAAGDYAGGWVWATPEEAHRFIAIKGLTATHSVYGVKADWATDTVARPGEPYRRLARDAEVTRLVDRN